MCGRFTLTIEIEDLQAAFELENMASIPWTPRFNIAPSQPVAVITQEKPHRIEWMNWGLVPSWSKDPQIGNRLINARAETLAEKPSFKNAYTRRRCLIPADGFYEWMHLKKGAGKGDPYYFSLSGHHPFAFAGIWELWQNSQGDEIYSCSIITCAANELVKPIHERMPVILDEKSSSFWLGKHSVQELNTILVPYASEKMRSYPVSPMVNNPVNENADCIKPV